MSQRLIDKQARKQQQQKMEKNRQHNKTLN